MSFTPKKSFSNPLQTLSSLRDPKHDDRVHHLGPWMHLDQHLQSDLLHITAKLENLNDVSNSVRTAHAMRRQKTRLTGYRTLLRPFALLATTNVPGLNLLTRFDKIDTLDAVSIPTSAARKTTSNCSQLVCSWPEVSSALTSVLANVILSPCPSLAHRS